MEHSSYTWSNRVFCISRMFCMFIAVAGTFRLGWTGSSRHPSARQFTLTVCEGANGVELFSVNVCGGVIGVNSVLLLLLCGAKGKLGLFAVSANQDVENLRRTNKRTRTRAHRRGSTRSRKTSSAACMSSDFPPLPVCLYCSLVLCPHLTHCPSLPSIGFLDLHRRNRFALDCALARYPSVRLVAPGFGLRPR